MFSQRAFWARMVLFRVRRILPFDLRTYARKAPWFCESVENPMTYRDITTLDDPLYDDYLDLYQKAFPLNEQMLVSDFNRALRRNVLEEPTDQRLVAAVASDGNLAGMARYSIDAISNAGVLWYLAVSEDSRGLGTGSGFYAEIVRRLTEELPGLAALVFEVERPDCAGSPEDAVLAERRIRFYQRNGARLLCGVDYVQSTGWQPDVPMHLMVHSFSAKSPEEAFNVCSVVFGNSLRQTGTLSLLATG